MHNFRKPIDNFSVALNQALRNRYGKVPSATHFMNEFNMRAYGTKFITRETARKWLKGLGLPRSESMQIIVDWLNINPVEIFAMATVLKATSPLPISDDIDNVRSWHERRNIEQLAKLAILSVSPRIAILNLEGEIILVNQAWRDMAFANSQDGGKKLCEGVNYLEVCDKISSYDKEFSHPMASGIRRVILDDKASYTLKYPCYSQKEKRWFTARVTSYSKSNERFVIVYHESFGELEEWITPKLY